MRKIALIFLKVAKGLYDLVAGYLLLFIVALALSSTLWHFLALLIAQDLPFDAFIKNIASHFGVSSLIFRLVVFGLLNALTLLTLRVPLRLIGSGLERVFDRLQLLNEKLGERLPRLKIVGGVLFTLFVSAALVPFVVQPTLVPLGATMQNNLERVANLIDGSATYSIADSVVGFYRQFYADDTKAVGGVSKDEVDQFLSQGALKNEPMMNRWNEELLKATGGDAEKFARLKAFMWVESAGMQFAVSRTGCLGLYQFCSPTAQDRAYKKIFGVGQIYRCSCAKTSCAFSNELKRSLELGSLELSSEEKSAFPCELKDARFDAKKSIEAGAKYVDRLSERFGGNLYLMYIGYNSGPTVASRVYKAVANNPNASLEEISKVLPAALQKTYKNKAKARANGLSEVHLPKIQKAYERYLPKSG